METNRIEERERLGRAYENAVILQNAAAEELDVAQENFIRAVNKLDLAREAYRANLLTQGEPA